MQALNEAEGPCDQWWNVRCIYTLTLSAEYAALHQLIGGPINVNAIEDDWEHISLTGDYLWSDMKLPEDGFRPLRTQNRQSEA